MKLEKIFKELFVPFIKSQELEYNSILEVENIMKKYYDCYTEGENKLNAKKESLFKSKNFEKWKLDPQLLNSIGKKALLNNKPLALSKMLPKETEEVQNNYISFVYYANRVTEEVARINKQKDKAYKKRLAKLYDRQDGLSQEVKLI